MSGGRTVIGLLAGIAAAIGAHVALDMRTREAPQALRRNALLPAAESARTFTVARIGEPETRLETDGGCKIVKPYLADAEPSVVLRMVDALAFAPIMDEMTDAELLRIGRAREDFGLDKPRVVVTVADSKSRVATPVRFGLPTPAGDGVYATVGKSDTVYVVSSNVFAAASLDTAGFRRRRVVAVEPESVVSFDVKNGKGRFARFVRDGKAWAMSEPRKSVASSERIHKFLDSVFRLEARDFVWPTGATNEVAALSKTLLASYGLLDDATAAVTLKDANGTDHAIGFGSDAGKGLVYALTPDGSVVTVPADVRANAAAGVDAFIDTRLFPLDAMAVNAVSLDDNGTAYLLSRSADARWRLDAPVSAAADAESANALIGRLLALKSSDVAVDGIRVSVGTNALPVSVSRQALLADLRLSDLRSKEILGIDPRHIKRVVTTDSGKTPESVLFDAERETWAIENASGSVTVDVDAVTKLAEALHSLKAIRIAKLKVSASELGQFGLDKPIRTVALDQTDENSVRRNLLIGDVTDGGRYVTLSASDAVFVIVPERADALLAPIVK